MGGSEAARLLLSSTPPHPGTTHRTAPMIDHARCWVGITARDSASCGAGACVCIWGRRRRADEPDRPSHVCQRPPPVWLPGNAAAHNPDTTHLCTALSPLEDSVAAAVAGRRARRGRLARPEPRQLPTSRPGRVSPSSLSAQPKPWWPCGPYCGTATVDTPALHTFACRAPARRRPTCACQGFSGGCPARTGWLRLEEQ